MTGGCPDVPLGLPRVEGMRQAQRSVLVALVSVAGLGVALTAGGVAPAAAASASGVQEAVTSHQSDASANAVAAVVLDDGAPTFAAAGSTTDGAVDEHTPFRIASMSKSFTATLAMILHESGELDLDAPLTDALPSFSMADPRFRDTTMRMLLAHTSGLGHGIMAGFGMPENVDADRFLDDLADEQLGSDPGMEHVYFNGNDSLAAVAIEQVTDESFADALEDAVLDPLGMDETEVVADCGGAVDGAGSGHTVAFGVVVPMSEPSDNCVGSGGVVSTTADLAR